VIDYRVAALCCRRRCRLAYVRLVISPLLPGASSFFTTLPPFITNLTRCAQ